MAQGTARLLISCPDRKGIISAVAGFIASHNGNILERIQAHLGSPLSSRHANTYHASQHDIQGTADMGLGALAHPLLDRL